MADPVGGSTPTPAETASPYHGATSCTNCSQSLALMVNPAGGPLLAHDFEDDGYTPSSQRHACGENDRNAYGPAGDTASPTIRKGFEQFTGAFHPVTWSQDRADADLPPWVSDLDGQYFMDSEVEEVRPDV